MKLGHAGRHYKCSSETDTGCRNSPKARGYNCLNCAGAEPEHCYDIDECAAEEGPAPCSDGHCTNTEGGYTCTCSEGPCDQPDCQGSLCGNHGCYSFTEATISADVTGLACENEIDITILRVGEDKNSVELKCQRPLNMVFQMWYLGSEKVAAGQDSLVIKKTSLKKDTLVTCVVKSRWINRVARGAVLVEAASKGGMKKSSASRKDRSSKAKNKSSKRNKNKTKKGKRKRKKSKYN